MSRRLNIKNLTPRKDSGYRQGYFTPIRPEKYIGDPGKIIYRSSWEKKFMTFCDINEKVICWSSETIQVPYLNPIENSTKIYNLDFYFKVREEDGSFKEYIAEIKPSKKLEKPVLPNTRLTEKRVEAHNYQMKEYLTNIYKFQAAKQWAEERNWEFMIVTEKFLY
jgi:hypothetical protein